MEQTAKISILMPVYNAEKYLRAALDSVLNQTLRDIELICVEDGSTDGSPAILEEYAARDARMQVLRHAENQGTLVARKHCMQAVRGQYVMWLDPDDALALDACETVWNEMRRSPVDVLQFGMKVVPFDGADEKAQAAMQQLLEPWPKAVRGDLVRACFVEHKWGWTGCNKAYPAALCKQAAEFLQEAYITLCEDQYIAFVLFSLAKSYRSIEKVLYFYSFGRGLTGNSQQWKRYFTSVCQQAQIYRALERFLDVRGGKAHRPVLAELKADAQRHVVGTWFKQVPPSEARAAYEEMFRAWGAADVVPVMAQLYGTQKNELLRRLAPAGCPRKIPVKHLAVYAGEADGNANGIGQLLPLFAEMGYRVTLVTDETPGAPADHEMALPAGVERAVLPSAAVSQGENYAARAEAWQALVERREIDTVLYCAWRTPLFFWDACVLKGLGCALVVQAREAFSAAFAENYLRGAAAVNAVRLADAAAAPAAFVEFWRNLCPAYGVEPPENDDSAACKAAWQKLFDDVGSGAAVMPQEPTAEQRMVELWLEDLQRGASGYSEQTERLLNSKFHTMARVYWKCKDKGLAAVRKLKHKLRR